MLRVTNVSSPRSGNNWVRGVLSAALELEPLAVHDFAEVGELPSGCAFSGPLVSRTAYQRFLSENNFPPAGFSSTPPRHPAVGAALRPSRAANQTMVTRKLRNCR